MTNQPDGDALFLNDDKTPRITARESLVCGKKNQGKPASCAPATQPGYRLVHMGEMCRFGADLGLKSRIYHH